MRSNLSGNATTAFDWGYVGTGQLSVALLADLLGNDAKAKAMCEAFENAVVAHMPHESWTMTEYALATALAPLVGVDGARADDHDADAMAEDTAAATSMVSEGGPLAESGSTPANNGTLGEAVTQVIKAQEKAVDAANVALKVAKKTHQATRAGDTPADEAMSTANRAADHKVYSAGRTVEKAAAVAGKSSSDEVIPPRKMKRPMDD